MNEKPKQKRPRRARPDDREAIILRCPPNLHWRIKLEAMSRGTNKNDLILNAIARELGEPYESRSRRRAPRSPVPSE